MPTDSHGDPTTDATMSGAVEQPSLEDDRRTVAALDVEFQAAVKHHDAATIDRIQHPDMVLVLGDGRIHTKADHLAAAREKTIDYEIQDEEPGTQTVRVLGDTAVVTALLRLKGTQGGTAFDRLLWFSDTYVRTPDGWQYFFGQASLMLPEEIPLPSPDRASVRRRGSISAPRRRARTIGPAAASAAAPQSSAGSGASAPGGTISTPSPRSPTSPRRRASAPMNASLSR